MLSECGSVRVEYRMTGDKEVQILRMTLDELINAMEPQARKDKALISKCVDGLTEYAAELRQKAGDAGKEQISALRRLVDELAGYQLLCCQAKECRLTKRAYLARLIEGRPVKARPTKEIKELRTEIHHIGNNINQIARSVNAGIAKPEDAERGLYLLDQVYELMFRIANK